MNKNFVSNRLLAALLCAALLSTAPEGPAATLTVNEPTDAALRSAIEQAAPGDRIQIAVSGTILLTNGELVLNKALSISGPTGTNRVTLAGNGLSRIFNVGSVTVSLLNLTIVQGNASLLTPPIGGGILNGGQLTLQNCVLAANRATSPTGTNGHGGGIYNTGNLTLLTCRLTDNSASALGGGLYNAGAATITTGLLTNNAATGGGGIYSDGSVALTGTDFWYNRALTSGGGALDNGPNGIVTANDCEMVANTSAYFGGGAILNFGSLSLAASALRFNVVSNDSGQLQGGGGAIFNSGGRVQISSSVVGPENVARRGAGILNAGTGTNRAASLVVNRSTVYGNTALLFGGGIMNLANGDAATAWLTNCTVSANIANQDQTGPGFDNSAYTGRAQATLVNCTVARNISPAFGIGVGGGIYSGKFGANPADSAEVRIANSIVASNSAVIAVIPQMFEHNGGSVVSLGYNLCSDNSARLTATGDRPNTSPGLGLFSGFVYGLLGTSPAIDAGPVNATEFAPTDQRGIRRPFGMASDIGAIEQALVITNMVRFPNPVTGPNIQLRFLPYRYGTNYIVEYSTTLFPNDWVVVRSNITVNAEVVAVSHSNGATAARRFYRVRVPASQ